MTSGLTLTNRTFCVPTFKIKTFDIQMISFRLSVSLSSYHPVVLYRFKSKFNCTVGESLGCNESAHTSPLSITTQISTSSDVLSLTEWEIWVFADVVYSGAATAFIIIKYNKTISLLLLLYSPCSTSEL